MISSDYNRCYKYTCIGNLKHLNYMKAVLICYLSLKEFKVFFLYFIYPWNTSLRVSFIGEIKWKVEEIA